MEPQNISESLYYHNLTVLAFIVLAFCILILTVVIFVLPFGVIKNNNNY